MGGLVGASSRRIIEGSEVLPGVESAITAELDLCMPPRAAAFSIATRSVVSMYRRGVESEFQPPNLLIFVIDAPESASQVVPVRRKQWFVKVSKKSKG